MGLFTITYDVVTPESAEQGDTADRGFVHPNGGEDTLDSVPPGAADYRMTLSQAVRMMGCVEDGGAGFYECDGRENYTTGASTRYALHPPRSITPASYARVKRALQDQRLLVGA